MINDSKAKVFKVFYAWPCLRVLQCNWCNLFNSQTCIIVAWATLTHLQMTGVGPAIECAELSIVNIDAHVDCIQSCIGNAFCASCLVCLQLSFDEVNPYIAAHLAESICSLLETCPQLRVLSLKASLSLAQFPSPATLALTHTHRACLQEVQLYDLPFDVVYSENSSCLYIVGLRVDSRCVLCKLSLLTSLHDLKFEGCHLFTEQGRFALCDSTALTKLVLYPTGQYKDGYRRYKMPVLPNSLVYFSVTSLDMRSFDLFGGTLLLQACDNLEQLKLVLSSQYANTIGLARVAPFLMACQGC